MDTLSLPLWVTVNLVSVYLAASHMGSGLDAYSEKQTSQYVLKKSVHLKYLPTHAGIAEQNPSSHVEIV